MFRERLQPFIAILLGMCGLFAVLVPAARADEALDAPDSGDGRMTPARLRGVLEAEGLDVEGDWPQIAFYVHNSRIYGFVDEANDRVRFMVPVARAADLEPEQVRNLLKANYVATGDIRFAINRDVVWLVYAHPLSSVTLAEITGAINQLARHAQQFLPQRPE